MSDRVSLHIQCEYCRSTAMAARNGRKVSSEHPGVEMYARTVWLCNRHLRLYPLIPNMLQDYMWHNEIIYTTSMAPTRKTRNAVRAIIWRYKYMAD
jgi:hypothetical protein